MYYDEGFCAAAVKQQYETATHQYAPHPESSMPVADYAQFSHMRAGEQMVFPQFTGFSPVSQPASPPSLPSAVSQRSPMSSSSGRQCYQNWSFAPTSRAQRRYVLPEIYAKRRATANQRERGRMTEMNRAFDRLRSLIPMYPVYGRKVSKIDTLRLARQYIADLTSVNEHLEEFGTIDGYDFAPVDVDDFEEKNNMDKDDVGFTSPCPSSSSGSDSVESALSSSGVESSQNSDEFTDETA